MSPEHVVVIGAARSGTRLLRDTLAAATGTGSVPYDIGYVWRYGNEDCPDDVLDPDMIDERHRRFIQRFLDRYADGVPLTVTEKSVGNTMRVAAVDSVLPKARFVHLLRDGVDVVESARRQWTASADMSYLIRKAGHMPFRMAPRLIAGYARSVVGRRQREGGRVATWGPRYPGIDADLRSRGLLTVCARQWRESVTRASADLTRLGVPVLEVRYERLVSDPIAETVRLAEYLDLPIHHHVLVAHAAAVTTERQGRGRRALNEAERDIVHAEIGDLLSECGYAGL